MCGIVGFIDRTAVYSLQVLKKMTDAIVHRGPDDDGHWCDIDAGIALGHRRLSILDLSPAGHQPMLSASGRFVIIFNGEIYNHLDIRKTLGQIHPGPPLQRGVLPVWRGNSDTETLLAAFDAWGIEATIQKTIGMFALAVWDKAERTLTIARDRMGEKPLYYGWNRGVFLFASELKAIRAYPGFDAEIDRNTLPMLMRHNYIPGPYSIYSGIFKLPPGTLLTLKSRGMKSGILPEPVTFWSLGHVAETGQRAPFAGSEQKALSILESILKDAIGKQMLSDVPLGAFLSGGVDSSTIVALMQSMSGSAVRTFTIGFHEKEFNEADHAKAVARHLGTDHTELYVTAQDALAVIPQLPMMYDEPFSDSSQIPTFLVSQMTRQHVKVGLSGDAGDELFGGYTRYFLANRIWNAIPAFPLPLRQFACSVIKSFKPTTLSKLGDMCNPLLQQHHRYPAWGDKLYKLTDVISAGTREEVYQNLISHWNQPQSLVIGAALANTYVSDVSQWPDHADFVHTMMHLDAVSYLPDDILVKVDRAAMAVSLETRVPFLDYRVVEFAWQLPLSMKIRNGQGKWLLRQLLYKYVPKELIERPKVGFGVPLDSWLRGPLREWAEALLDETRLKREGFFNPAPIRQKWQEHLSGQHNWQYHLWDVITFQAWLENIK